MQATIKLGALPDVILCHDSVFINQDGKILGCVPRPCSLISGYMNSKQRIDERERAARRMQSAMDSWRKQQESAMFIQVKRDIFGVYGKGLAVQKFQLDRDEVEVSRTLESRR